MNRWHILRGCVMFLLFFSCGLSAQEKAQDMDPEEIKTVVKEYLQAVQLGRDTEAFALSAFQDDKEKTSFQEKLKTRGPLQKWNLKQSLHVVHAKREDGHVQALLLLPTKQGFIPERFTVREEKGQLKVVQSRSEKAKRSDRDVVSAKVAELKESLKSWESAQGAALAEKIRVFKEQLQEEIDTLEYAKTKGLQVVPGYGDLAKRRKVYNDVRNLSADELRAKMVKEIQSALETLSP